jgi:hypothetical protein
MKAIESLIAHQMFKRTRELGRIKGICGWRPAAVVVMPSIRHGARLGVKETSGWVSEAEYPD